MLATDQHFTLECPRRLLQQPSCMMYTALHGMGVSQIKGCAQLFYFNQVFPRSNGSNKIS